MKALVFFGVNDIRYRDDWPEPPEPGYGEVTIRTSWTSICRTDIEEYEQGIFSPIEKPHPISGKQVPIIFGHEVSGRIYKKGPGVEGLEIGQKVAIDCVKGCKKCYWCDRGEYALCENMLVTGQGEDGGYGEYFNTRAENCLPISDNLREDVAALTEPFAVMIRAAKKARLQVGESVAIVGAGAVGLCGIAAAKVAGASEIIVVAHGGIKAEAAVKIGATHVLNSFEDNWFGKFNELTDGRGADVVFDTGGNIEAVRLALKLTKAAGRCILASLITEDIPIPGFDMLMREKELIGSVAHNYNEEFKWAVRYLEEGRVDLSPMITRRIRLSEGLEKGINIIKTDKSQIKILLTPHDDWVED